MGSNVSSSRGRETSTVVGNVSSLRASPSVYDAIALSPNIPVPSFAFEVPRVSIKTSPPIRKARLAGVTFAPIPSKRTAVADVGGCVLPVSSMVCHFAFDMVFTTCITRGFLV